MSQPDPAPQHPRFDLPAERAHHDERPKSSGSESVGSGKRSVVIEDTFQTSALQARSQSEPWNRRPRSPNLKWYKNFDKPDSCRNGRVYMVDYVKKEHSQEGMRKVAAQEFDNIDSLRRLYANPDRGQEAVLRVLHVQNAPWATHLLLKKYNISDRDDLVGTTFGRYVKYKRPEKRGGKPFISGKSWKTTRDPWRGISRTSFGLDYLRPSKVNRNAPITRATKDSADKMMELNCYDEQDNPIYGYDVFVQRISCYIQKKEELTEVLPTPDIQNPYEGSENHGHSQQHGLRLEDLDNGNTIIIFENSQSGSIEDTLIGARQEWESKWRRLPFYLTYEQHDVSNDDRLATDCMKIILQDVLKSLTESWESFLDITNNHVSILEDKIYEEPADESRAPELWTNSSWWLKVERLVSIHSNLVKEMQLNLRDLSDPAAPEDYWLESSTGDMERISDLVQESLVKPTANLADLMYKSVEIRDSRHGLQLNTSMWRLSWITFIFLYVAIAYTQTQKNVQLLLVSMYSWGVYLPTHLCFRQGMLTPKLCRPLTFMVGFFGMNVDTFSSDPSIKWYFIVAIPMMALVLLCWYFVKHSLAQQRQTPYSRGVYDHLFHEMATQYPSLWSRTGPRDFVRPRSTLDRLRWKLVLFWNRPEKTTKLGSSDEDAVYDDLGTWARMKRLLTRRWTSRIRNANNFSTSESVNALESGEGESTELIGGVIGEATNILTAPVTEHAENMPGGMLSVNLPSGLRTAQRIIESRRDSTGRPDSRGSSAGRNSGVMIEEEKPTWLQDFGGRGHHVADWSGSAGAATKDAGSQSRRPSYVPSSPLSNPSPEDSRPYDTPA